MKFRLYYHVSSGGDGSVSVHFHETAEAAQKAEASMDESWGEDCNSYVDLTLKDGKLSYSQYELNEDYSGGYVTKHVEEIK